MMVNEKMAREALDLLRSRYQGTEDISTSLHTVSEHGVNMMYRAAAMATHPDKGGSAEQFAAVDRAKHILLAWLEKPRPAAPEHKKKPCDYCHGEGFLYMPSRQPGSMGLRRTCPKCRGSGDADIDLHNP